MFVSRASVTQHPPVHHPKQSRSVTFFFPSRTPSLSTLYLLLFPSFLFPAHNFFFFLWNLFILLSLVFLVLSLVLISICVTLFKVFVISLFILFYLFIKNYIKILGLCMWHGFFCHLIWGFYGLFTFFWVLFFIFSFHLCVCLSLCVWWSCGRGGREQQKGKREMKRKSNMRSN
jgi:hypothetical protein